MKTTIKEISLRVTELEKIFNRFVVQSKQNYDSVDIFYSDTTFEEFIKSFEYVMRILRFLTKSHNLFLTITTESERTDILNNLSNLISYMPRGVTYANDIIIYTDRLKTIIRQYDGLVLTRKEYVSEFKDELLELQKQAVVIKEIFNHIKEDVDKKEELANKMQDLQDKYGDLSSYVNDIQNTTQNASEILEDMQGKKDNFDDFFDKIDTRTKELDNQQLKTDDFVRQLKEFKEQQDLKMEEAEKLINDAKKALHYKTTEGISAAIQAQYDDAKQNTLGWWLFVAIIFLGLGIGFGIYALFQELTIFGFIGRFAIITLLVGAAIFSAQQYVRQKNIIEDYAYKLVLVKSIIGFSEELLKIEDKTNSGYQIYITRTLNELLQDPLRYKGGKANDLQLAPLVKEVLELSKEIKGLVK
ncbi:hypothetical protein BKN14_02565 [Candidatus Gracilibacteria bacterium HOT-871]|nr:hypothetical protein BKN14_02565 [Candidatus Gracilibacteria bacterium HOT-871]